MALTRVKSSMADLNYDKLSSLISTDTTLNILDAGKTLNVYDGVITLPALSAGRFYKFVGTSDNVGASVKTPVGVSLRYPDGTAVSEGSVELGPNESLEIVSSSTDWIIIRMTGKPLGKVATLDSGLLTQATFKGVNRSLTTSGFQKLPGGLILQWGSTPAATNTVFPIAFPTAALQVIPQHDYNAGGINGAMVYISALSTTGFTRQEQTFGCRWLVIGY